MSRAPAQSEFSNSFLGGVLRCRTRRRRCPSRLRCSWRQDCVRLAEVGWCGSGGKRIGTGATSSWGVPFWWFMESSPHCKTKCLGVSTLLTGASSSCSPLPGLGLSTASGRIAGTSSAPSSPLLAFLSSCSCPGKSTSAPLPFLLLLHLHLQCSRNSRFRWRIQCIGKFSEFDQVYTPHSSGALNIN